MFFYISKLASPFSEPIAIVFAILAVSSLLFLSGRGRWARRGVGVSVALMGFVLFTPLDYWVTSPLEDRFPVPAPPACLDGIVVLSGGEEPRESLRRGTALLGGSPMRYVVLGELMRRYPAARVIFSGGSGSLVPTAMSEAAVAKAVMARLQFDTSRVLFEDKSRNTWENAVFAKDLARPQAREQWALLAPASQMPRAVGSFRKIGWDVLPWPTDFTAVGRSWWPLSASRRFGVIDAAEHQWLGLLVYWVTGRSSQLFPGPEKDQPAGTGDKC